jgi:hypothetical protein
MNCICIFYRRFENDLVSRLNFCGPGNARFWDQGSTHDGLHCSGAPLLRLPTCFREKWEGKWLASVKEKNTTKKSPACQDNANFRAKFHPEIADEIVFSRHRKKTGAFCEVLPSFVDFLIRFVHNASQ